MKTQHLLAEARRDGIEKFVVGAIVRGEIDHVRHFRLTGVGVIDPSAETG